MDKKIENKWVRMPDGSEYSGEYDFFLREQVIAVHNRQGTSFNSRLNGQRLLGVKDRNPSHAMVLKLCAQIHKDIFALKYGGVLVE